MLVSAVICWNFDPRIAKLQAMTIDELQREYATLRQQADAVRSYL